VEAVDHGGADADEVPIGARAALVERRRLVDGLRAAASVPVVLVVGSAGYGKTTLVSQWLRDDPRSVVWLTATVQHDDPAVLLADVVRALDELEPLEPRAKQRLSATAIDFSSVLVPRLERVVAERGRPFVLVVDDTHRLHRRTAWALVQALADCVPAGSQLVLVSRAEPDLALGRMRADRRVHEVAATNLAMDRPEAAELLAAGGLDLTPRLVDRLWDRTEGWPVGLYLAALAIREADDPNAAAADFAGDDRIVAEYLRDELLGVLPRRARDFLLRASILDELRAPICDAVLERSDSSRVLVEVARSLSLLIPLDRRDEGFRMHQLMRDTLRAELARRTPEEESALHRRAAVWYGEHGDDDRMIEHLRRVGDADAIETAVWRAGPVYAGIGRTATLARWLEVFDDDESRARPAIAACRSWLGFMTGDVSSMRYWAIVTSDFDEDRRLPDGNLAGGAAALLRALVGAGGIEAMRRDAAHAYELDRVGSPFRAIACYLEGAALRLQGHDDAARARLVEGEAIGAAQLPATQAQSLAQLAALATDRGDHDRARQHVQRLLGVLDRFELRERPAQGNSLAVASFVLARAGDTTAASEEANHALFLVSMLGDVAPWIAAEARRYLGRTFLLLGDVAVAQTLLREGRELAGLIPDGDLVVQWLAEVERSVTVSEVPIGVLASPMTPAELRVLRYLPTHLTFAAIADELFVSRNTVKTQAISIYRKLGVSSRGPAVEAARGLGLLEESARSPAPGDATR
jgi:LuxR family maltose regulon positive regulatory protein